LIIGIAGLCVDSAGNTRTAGAGKDTVANILFVRRHVVTVAFADAFKRIVKDVYGFTDEQLWGPSQMREVPDKRYLRRAAGSLGSIGVLPNPPEDLYLTPRFALLQFGSAAGRACYENTWTDYGIRVAQQLISDNSKMYTPHRGVQGRDFIPSDCDTEEELEALEEEQSDYPDEVSHVAFSDMRFFNEVAAIKAAGGKVVRVRRTLPTEFQGEFDTAHESERQVADLPDEDFDYVLENDSSLEVLQLNTLRMFDVLAGKIRPYDDAQRDVPPFMRKGS
jgi:hypothetical protein